MPACAGPQAVSLGRYFWTSSDPAFGGLSSIDLDAGGTAFRVVTDYGFTATGRLERDAAGVVTAAEAEPFHTLLGDAGEPLARHVRDAEGLAIGPGTSYYVSFEGPHQLSFYPDDGQPGQILSYGLHLPPLADNNGPEALALAPDGGIYLIAEGPANNPNQHPVYVYRNGEWSVPFSLRHDGFWRPVGADFGPDGRLYVLFRDVWGLVGFRSRIVRLALSGDVITAEETLLETRAGDFGNLEGLAVWRDGTGTIRITTVSDDNRLPVLSTEIADFRVAE
ncbi:MAG: hypothetical protein RLZZ528_2197 [Pseudomonadota bacterium]|jgi:hypothetical protein